MQETIEKVWSARTGATKGISISQKEHTAKLKEMRDKAKQQGTKTSEKKTSRLDEIRARRAKKDGVKTDEPALDTVDEYEIVSNNGLTTDDV